ncbi:GNAT family N-acetyltransferase [Bacillus mycoides]|uniref:GNAT family N-acetyltransferase n=1 Tax=Bacillus mycoides TaxID=1405 RepID=UPI001C030F72|nr:GNAT family N-acetyltransferase [Bacillus mycoides]QWG50530.1 GNAT family N-acetyltransferase [Bacillus mycoides]QWG56100.1 GNAT family N-acetyltransferase [Bacillus mycoides]QWG71088.1 GNAT family N-acetyltransferase [Bacillus mycoides]QWH23097.1 GNAT family N-acetyltransferase [Bacillus mycoides]QWH34334.1 GNAT family N-acetyltransferase [Bacillus mycoides]
MIEYRKARVEDIQGIIKVCSDGYRNTYPGLLPQQYIESTIKEFYNDDRVRNEILNISQEWNGWFVASDNGEILGAGGGGFTGKETAELFVIYLNPNRKREGIGTELLSIITNNQIERGAKEQWVSVAKDNDMGIPFYEAVGFKYQDGRPAYGLPVGEGFTSIRYKRELAISLVER